MSYRELSEQNAIYARRIMQLEREVTKLRAALQGVVDNALAFVGAYERSGQVVPYEFMEAARAVLAEYISPVKKETAPSEALTKAIARMHKRLADIREGKPVPPVTTIRDLMEAGEPVAWRYKERINNEFDTGWCVSPFEPMYERVIVKEPLYLAPPAGWVTVPPEPTPEMYDAVLALNAWPEELSLDEIYKAMIGAAKEPKHG